MVNERIVYRNLREEGGNAPPPLEKENQEIKNQLRKRAFL
jgi:hypothetical protein